MLRSLLISVFITAVLLLVFQNRAPLAQSGDSLHTSSPQFVMPATPAGQCASAYIKAFNSGSNEVMRGFILRYRTEEYLKTRPMDEQLDSYRMIYESCESLAPVRVSLVEGSETIIICRPSRSNGVVQIGFQMDTADPSHLRVFTIDHLASDATAVSVPVNAQLIENTITSIAEILKDQYVYPEKGKAIGDSLKARLATGRYSGIAEAAVFAQRVSGDLLSISKDEHIGFQYGTPPEEEDSKSESMTYPGYGFSKVETLTNNIGYVKFDHFCRSEEAMQAAAQALAAVANCDALIFDLRQNRGGAAVMLQFIAGYLFDKPTLLGIRYSRTDDDTVLDIYTKEQDHGKVFAETLPVYVLTSSNTFSAAEAFAFFLRELKRVTVVGETTGGGAHPVYGAVVNDKFWISVPFARTVGPVSKTDWEGVGVIPDIQVPAGQALETARMDAKKKLALQHR